MNNAATHSAIDPRILDEAADWLMRLHAGDATDADQAACERWRQISAEHARAWTRAQALVSKLGGLPKSLAMPALDRPAKVSRRAAMANLGKFAVLLAAIPAGWTLWRELEREGWTADHRTAAGERRELQLTDGTRIVLNTASAIDVRFDDTQRPVLLRAGEILVTTGHQDTATHRPFRVVTPQGRMEALGTHFNVRQDEGRTRIAVFEGAVRIEPGQSGSNVSAPLVLQAGQQTSFSETQIAPVAVADSGIATAWTRGMLLADNMPLSELAAELARYRRGVVQCDANIADLRVTGSFPVGSAADTDRSLTMLVSTYPVAAQLRLRGLWVTLVKR